MPLLFADALVRPGHGKVGGSSGSAPFELGSLLQFLLCLEFSAGVAAGAAEAKHSVFYSEGASFVLDLGIFRGEKAFEAFEDRAKGGGFGLADVGGFHFVNVFFDEGNLLLEFGFFGSEGLRVTVIVAGHGEGGGGRQRERKGL